MKVTSFIAQFLKEKNIDTVFELQGGMITNIIDEIYRHGGINIVSMHHEQAAAFAADGYARIKNIPGIAIATSGPGATNLITGIGSCFFDSVPAIFITGQVKMDEQKGERPTRQIGFQETDIVSIVKPITKAAYAVKNAEEIPMIFENAYEISLAGRPGPVLIDIPMDIQNQDIILMLQNQVKKSNPGINIYHENDFFTKLNDALETSKRPLCLAGRGIRAAGATDQFINFIDKHNLPVVTSLLAIDSIPYSNPHHVGFIGTYGNRWANHALGSCDMLLVLGSRLDLRQTGVDIDIFQKNKTIFHIDIDNAELNNRIKGCVTLNADLHDFFRHCSELLKASGNHEEWFSEIKSLYLKYPDTKELKSIKGINPNIFIHLLSRKSHLASVITTDVGNNQMWAAQSFEVESHQLFLSSGGMGAMGYSLPASIGAAFALNKSPVLCIAGDGGFQINIQELQTIKRNKLPIKIVILNNHCLGMIRQFQDSYFNSCYQSTVWGYDAPDFEKIAKAYGIDAFSIKIKDEINKGLSLLWEYPDSPFLLNINIDTHTNVFPKMMYGNPLTRMEPDVSHE